MLKSFLYSYKCTVTFC